MNRELLNQIAAALGLSPEDQALCEEAGSHPDDCSCGTCLKWWRSIGVDPDTGLYGPFTIEQIEGQSMTCERCLCTATRVIELEPDEPDALQPKRRYFCDEHFFDV